MTPQQEFDARYITTREIMNRLSVSRPAITHAVKRGDLPVPHVRLGLDATGYLWLRADVWPLLAAWNDRIQTRRAVHA